MNKFNFIDGQVPDLCANVLNTMQDNIEEVGVQVGTTEPTTNEKVWFKFGKNKFNKNNVTKGIGLSEAGDILNNNYDLSDFIAVKASTKYTYSGLTNTGTTRYSAYYDINNTLISTFKQTEGSNTITTPNNCAFIKFSIRDDGNVDDTQTFMVEEGETASTYENYIEPTIYCKNSNGNFEELINFGKTRITTGAEFQSGRIVDGRIEYGKKIACGYLINGSSTYAHGITGNFSIQRYEGIYKHKDSGTLYNIPRSYPQNPNAYNVDCDIDTTNININAGTAFNGTTFLVYITVYYLKL